MYTVLLDGNLLYDSRAEELKIFSPILDFETNKSGSFDFMIYPEHPSYGQIKRLKSVVEVFKEGSRLFKGRVLDTKLGFFNEKSVSCEGEIAYLNDGIIRPYSYQGSITGFLTKILTEYNAQVDATKVITLGNVTVTDPNDFITRSSIDPASAWEVINSKLIGSLGGYLIIRYDGATRYLDYLIDSPYMSTQTIELSENLIDVQRETKGQGIITALIPYGAKLTEGSDVRLDIKSVNGGNDYITSAAGVAEYGLIFGSVIFDDVTIASNLLTKGTAYLNDKVLSTSSIDLTATDLSNMDKTIDDFRFFEYVKVKSDIHQLDETMLIKKIRINLLDPTANTMSVGATYKTLTEKRQQTDVVISEVIQDIAGTVNISKGYTDQVKTELQSSLARTESSLKSQFTETYTAKNDFESYKSEVSSQFVQTATDYTARLTSLEQIINGNADVSSAKFEEISSYLRYYLDAGVGTLELGMSDSPFTTKLTPLMLAFLESGNIVAYIKNSQLLIKEAVVLEGLTFGNHKTQKYGTEVTIFMLTGGAY